MPTLLEGRKWEKPDHYAGFNPTDDYLLMTKSRDAQIIDESNWEQWQEKMLAVRAALAEAEQDPDPDKPSFSVNYGAFGARSDERCRDTWLYIWRASCSMFGYFDYMMLRGDAPDSMKQKAEEILKALDAYPIISDDDYGERQMAAQDEFWKHASESERRYWHEKAGIEMQGDGEEMPSDVSDALHDSTMFD